MRHLAAAVLLFLTATACRAAGSFDFSKPTQFSPPILSEQNNLKEKITAPLLAPEKTPAKQNFAEKFFSKIVIPLRRGPLLLLPVLDSSKDLGPNYGVMPIWALRDDKRKAISSVLAPSLNYNEYLRTTLTYRHYFFPDDKQLWVIRGSWSAVVQRELFLRYNNPEFLGTQWRVNAEFRHWVNGKASFYGIGPETARGDQATFALNMTGEEFTVSMPMKRNLYLDFTHSYYQYMTAEGPVPGVPQLKDKYPGIFDTTSVAKNFMVHRLALFYDNTDHPVIPKNGTYAGISAAASRNGLASDYTYNTYTAEFKHYCNYKQQDHFVTALHGMIQDMRGHDTVPFYAMPVLGESTGLRSVGDGRYVGGGKVVFNIEERITPWRIPVLNFFSEFEFTPFLDMGQVFGTLDDIQQKQFQFGYGMAFRVVIRPQVVATADLAYGREGPNIIIHVGYPF
ncbi:MAG: BamA/TamA family outer membrane protein [Elusimicrobiales bacterium]|nr:BamA/TamA family outer membrane protein [Elusimicrobiales bacterium]